MSSCSRGRSCNRCEACKMVYPQTQSCAGKRPSYILLGENQTRILSRPSSADKYVKSTYTGYDKNASSDSKIEKTYHYMYGAKKSAGTSCKPKGSNELEINGTKAKLYQKHRHDLESSQLKDDLATIKDQLSTLARNKEEALQISNELQVRYQNLAKLTHEQEKIIDELKRQNESLVERMNQTSVNRYHQESYVMNPGAIFDYHKQRQSNEQVPMNYSEIMRESDVKYSKLLMEYQKVKENELRYAAENNELAQTVEELEVKMNRVLAELRKYQNESRLTLKQHHELRKQNESCLEQLKDKAKQIGDLNLALEQLKAQLNSCKRHSDEMDQLEQTNKKMKKQNNELFSKLKQIQENEVIRHQELDKLKDSERKMVEELMKLKNFSHDLSKISEESNNQITNLTRSNHEKEELIQKLQAECNCKEKQLEESLRTEEKQRKKCAKLQEELLNTKLTSSTPEKHNSNCCCNLDLASELKDLVTALYEEIEKTMAKEEHIQKQNKNICCLKCALLAKDKEIHNLRSEIIRIRENYLKSLQQQQQQEEERMQEEEEAREEAAVQHQDLNSLNSASSEECECEEEFAGDGERS